MGSWIRRLRGAIGFGLTWAIGWAAIGTIVAVLIYAFLGLGAPLVELISYNAKILGVWGFAGGTLFAGVLRLTEGRRRFDELSLPRFAAWGAFGGLLQGAAAIWSGLWGWYFAPADAGMLLATMGVGAGTAAASLAVARRADDRQFGPTEVADVDFSEAEWRLLLEEGDR